jgi:ABC-type xylose transport system permease subunit
VLVITTALVVLYTFVTTRTVIGRQIYAICPGRNVNGCMMQRGSKSEMIYGSDP